MTCFRERTRVKIRFDKFPRTTYDCFLSERQNIGKMYKCKIKISLNLCISMVFRQKRVDMVYSRAYDKSNSTKVHISVL